MGYYTRVLSTKAECIPLSQLRAALADTGLDGRIEAETDDSSDWTELVLVHADGVEIAAIERNPVVKGSLGAEEIEEFCDEVSEAEAEPRSAAEWLQKFFPKVKNIYAFQHLNGADKKKGFEMLNAVRGAVWASAPSIFQADNEGFSNEAGYAILWQFSESATGPWWMGIIQGEEWVHFQMNLGNKRHREAFRKGQIPKGVRYA